MCVPALLLARRDAEACGGACAIQCKIPSCTLRPVHEVPTLFAGSLLPSRLLQRRHDSLACTEYLKAYTDSRRFLVLSSTHSCAPQVAVAFGLPWIWSQHHLAKPSHECCYLSLAPGS